MIKQIKDIYVIVQARLSSERCPRKMIKEPYYNDIMTGLDYIQKILIVSTTSPIKEFSKINLRRHSIWDGDLLKGWRWL